jgi:hypothetical protein
MFKEKVMILKKDLLVLKNLNSGFDGLKKNIPEGHIIWKILI